MESRLNLQRKFLGAGDLDRFWFLGHQEHFAEDLRFLGLMLSWREALEFRENISPPTIPITATTTEREEIAAFQYEDMRLFEEALSLPEARLRAGPDAWAARERPSLRRGLTLAWRRGLGRRLHR